jgi:hypothetical protein
VNVVLLYNLNYIEVYINFEKYVIHEFNLCQMRLFEFIRVEGALSSLNILREAQAIKVWVTVFRHFARI